MARTKGLDAFISTEAAATPPPPNDRDTDSVTPGVRAGRPAPGPDMRAKYQRMARIEGRLSEEQVDALADLVRRLNRARHGEGERLTQNTLLRVAVDLLLTRADELLGVTEDELLVSLGLARADR